MIYNKYYNYLSSFQKKYYYFFYEKIMLHIIRFSNNLFFKEKYNEKNPLVSIIIATYNRSDILLNRTLPSILSQTYKNIEIIIVGDKCIDNTPALLTNYHDKRVKFYDLKKRGKYPQNIKDRWFVQGSVPRNKGMKLANGDWFIFISDDDVMFPNHVEVLLRNAIDLKVEFLSASYETVKNGKIHIVNPVFFTSNGRSVKIGGMQTWIFKSYLKFFKWNIDSWRKKWNRPVDYDLQLRFIDAGVKFGHINEIVYFNPPVEGTNTTGYEAALIADKLN
jgi:glycosyltransferase involved in cell wall biosynthesis